MDYTTSLDNVVHEETGHRMHLDSAAVPTVVSDKDMNMLIWSMMEVLAATDVAGKAFNPDDADSYQRFLLALRRIVQKGMNTTLTDTGALNAYVATNPVPLTAETLAHGVRQRVTIKTTNDGPATYAPDGLPAKPIVGLNLKPLQGLELLATSIADFEYLVAPSINGGNGTWLLLSCGGGAIQVPQDSYGATAPLFDGTNKLATTAAVRLALGSFNSAKSYSNAAGVALTSADVGKVLVAGATTAATTWTPPALSQVPVGGAIHICNLSGFALTVVQQNSADRFMGAFDPTNTATFFAMPNGSEVKLVKYLASTWLVLGR